jgi:DNA mismatch repair protein MutH
MNTPLTLSSLLDRAQQLAGRTVGDVATLQQWPLPENLLHAKGWIGQLIENFLGAQAGSLPMPDFPELGVELKTIPVDRQGKPRESTYVCVVPLTAEPGLEWETSLVWRKLQTVLWIPILSEPSLALSDRPFGTAILWKPSAEDISILRNDWEEFMTLISMGHVEEITARQGDYLQIRPKAANNKALTAGVNSEGESMATLPRGFYLRPTFTQKIVAHYLK